MTEIQLQVGVKVILKNSQRKYLLLKRSRKKYPDAKGRWDIAGGRILPGMPLVKNLEREVREETGLVLASDPMLVAAQDILRSPGKHVVRLTYTALAKGKVKLDTEENDEYRWLSIKEMQKLKDTDIYFKELLDKKLF